MTYKETYEKYSNSFLQTNITLNTSLFLEKQKMIERYNRYVKYETKSHLGRFTHDKFWTIMANSLISYDYVLKPTDVSMVLCDHFMEGAFKDDSIKLCANTLMRKTDFDNAMKRMLIKLYD